MLELQTTSDNPASISVRVLQPKFDESIPKYWFDGNSYLTHLIHALSFQFPPGEENFVKSVKHYAGRIADPALKKAILAFAGQELQHGQVHKDFNIWIAERFEPAASLCQQVAAILSWFYNLNMKQEPLFNLATTVVCEHLTVVMAASLLSKPELMERIDPQVRALLMWHAIEEIEHKSVAFDVYKAVGGSYLRLVWVMLQVTVSFTLATLYFQVRLLWADKQLFNVKALFGFLGHFIKRSGFFRGMGKRYLQFYSPRFHPSQLEQLEIPAHWDAKLAALSPFRVTLEVPVSKEARI